MLSIPKGVGLRCLRKGLNIELMFFFLLVDFLETPGGSWWFYCFTAEQLATPWYPEVLPAMLNATFLQDAKQRFVNLKSIEQRPACRCDGRLGSIFFEARNTISTGRFWNCWWDLLQICWDRSYLVNRMAHFKKVQLSELLDWPTSVELSKNNVKWLRKWINISIQSIRFSDLSDPWVTPQNDIILPIILVLASFFILFFALWILNQKDFGLSGSTWARMWRRLSWSPSCRWPSS